MYSHQESPLVHLLWSRPNTMLILFGLVHVRFHTALFASQTETVNKTTSVLKVIHSLVHPLHQTRVCLEPDRDRLFSWVSVRLFGPHPSAIAVFTPAQKIRTKGGNELELNSIKLNKTGVNTPWVCSASFMQQATVLLYSTAEVISHNCPTYFLLWTGGRPPETFSRIGNA